MGKNLMSGAVQDIRLAGGEVLSKRFILHRTMKDVLCAIRRATPKELSCRDELNGSLLHAAASTIDGLPIVMLLVGKGLDPNLLNDKGLKAVHYAKNSEIVLALLAYGSKTEMRAKSRSTSHA